jgi:hypothetical protein
MLVGNSILDFAGELIAESVSLSVGANDGSSGIAGKAGRLGSSTPSAAAVSPAVARAVPAGGKSSVGGAESAVSETPPAHCGAALLSAFELPPHGAGVNDAVPSDDPGVAKAGIPADDESAAAPPISAADRAGPSLIFVYRNTPTTTRIVIVTSGRIELIVRPP